MATKSLENDVQARLRQYVLSLIEQSTQRDVANTLGVAQSYISAFMSGKSGGGGKLLQAIANYDPRAFGELIGYETPTEERYSNREKAIRLLIADDRGDAKTIREAADRAAIALDADEDQSELKWVEMIAPFIKSARRGTESALGVRADEEDD